MTRRLNQSQLIYANASGLPKDLCRRLLAGEKTRPSNLIAAHKSIHCVVTNFTILGIAG